MPNPRDAYRSRPYTLLETAGGGPPWDALVKMHSRSFSVQVAAVDAPEWVKDGADFVCDGVADEEEFRAALTRVAIVVGAVGGTVKLSQGTFQFSATLNFTTDSNPHNLAWDAVGNITIEGMGRCTQINFNDADYVIDAGLCEGVSLLNFDTDAGGVDIFGAHGGIAQYWKEGVWTDTTTLAGEPQVLECWFTHADAAAGVVLGTLPHHAIVTAVKMYVEQAFNAGDTNLISVGGEWSAVPDVDAYSLDVDVSSIGSKILLAGVRLGVVSAEVDNPIWVLFTGTTPTTGKALVQVFLQVAPPRP